MSINPIFCLALVCCALTLLLLVFLFLNWGRGRFAAAIQNRTVNDQIYVGNLSYDIDEVMLKEYFSRFGLVSAIRIVRHFQTGRSKGYAFLTYSKSKQAVKSLAAHGKDLEGRSMVVRIAKPRTAGLPTYSDMANV